MADRFERLFELPSNLYSNGSPVIIEAGALLKDNQTGSIVVQIKYKSVSSISIKALRIDILAYDIAGNEIPGKKDYQYLDLSIQNGQSFGSTNAIILPNSTTRSFSIGSMCVILSDGTISQISLPLFELPASVTLDSQLDNLELKKEYVLATNNHASYIPSEECDLWQCSCGIWNKQDVCTCCGIGKHTVFSMLDIEILSQRMNERLEKERIAREEEVKQRIARERQRKQKNKKISVAAAILGGICIILLCVCWLMPKVIIPSIAYLKAEELFENKQFEEAIAAFTDLGDFKDSEDKLKQVKYQYAEHLLQCGKFNEAISEFQSIKNYGDAKERIKEAKYQHVLMHKDNNDKITYDYLSFLKSVSYKDAASIYSELYDWKVLVLGWSTEEDGLYKTSISKYSPVYCRFMLKGGIPGESVILRVSGTLPNGKDIEHTFKEAARDGSIHYIFWEDGIYTNPKYQKTGTLYLSFYDDDGNKIGSGSLKITE